MNKLRVLLFAASEAPTSGWGTYTRDLTALFRANEMEVTVLTPSAQSAFRLPGTHASRIAWWIAEARLQRWIRRHRSAFDVIHVMAEPYARLFHAFQGIPFVLTVHGSYGNAAMHGSGATRFAEALPRASALIAVSAFATRMLPEAFQSQAVVIHNGVNLAIADEPTKAPAAHGVPLIFSVGVLKPRKGFESLIDGFAVFRKAHPNAELVIAGPDPSGYRVTLEAHAERAGVAKAVRVLGEVSRPALLGWYRACTVFALTPNDQGGVEGFGLVYLEAAVFGKPSVGSRGSGAAEAIRHGASGILCDPSDSFAVADALTQASTLAPATIRAWADENAWSARAAAYRAVFERAVLSGSRNRG